MFENTILIQVRRVPWVKIGLAGATITGFVGVGVYWWTMKAVSVNNKVELVEKDFSKLSVEKEYRERKDAEQRECNGMRISLRGKEGCFKKYKNQ